MWIQCGSRTWSCWSLMGCALPWLALHRGHYDGQRLGGLWCGLGAQGAAGGGVRVMGVMYRHTADHVGPLASSRAARENKSQSQFQQNKTSMSLKVWKCKFYRQQMSSPGCRELPVILIFRVAVDGDDADSRTRCVRDDDGLRLVTSKSWSVLDHSGGRQHWRYRPGGGRDAPSLPLLQIINLFQYFKNCYVFVLRNGNKSSLPAICFLYSMYFFQITNNRLYDCK